ncbi:MAG: dihydrofolate reductase family protein, partial [Chloroflexi bacterium]|nr:dihydrofolate reductase family protein [Chloroflexota bacterium]
HGDGGEQLGEWRRELAAFRKAFPFAGLEGGVTNASTAVFEEDTSGAMIIGRNMFGGGHGPWGNPPWDGPWGGNPFHVPVFVLTHHPREPLVLHGDPPFTFVTEGIRAALEMAQQAAAGKDVLVGGSASAAKQYVAAGLLDQIEIHLVPVFLGEGL